MSAQSTEAAGAGTPAPAGKPPAAYWSQNGRTRRQVLLALPLSNAALVGPCVDRAEADGTLILRLFHENRALIAAAAVHPSLDDALLFDLFYRKADQIEAEMMALPCTCAADFAAKMIVGTAKGEIFPNWATGEIWDEARTLTGGEI